MASFDFITDKAFRESLESDFREMMSSHETGALKAVHVLSGSIVEALLVDSLIALGHVTEEAGLKMVLADATKAAAKAGLLSEEMDQLCAAIRHYRNLIHPGRVLRLDKKITAYGAGVAINLVHEIVEHVSKERTKTYGHTAEQIVSKVRGDPNSTTIPHMLRELKPRELERLVLEALPALLLDIEDDEFVDRRVRLAVSRTYREALAVAKEGLRRAAAAWYVDALKSSDEGDIHAYSRAFFRPQDASYLDDKSRKIARDHMLQAFDGTPEVEVFERLAGILVDATTEEAEKVINSVARIIAKSPSSAAATRGISFVSGELIATEAKIDDAMRKRAEVWVKFYASKGPSAAPVAAKLQELANALDTLPF